MRTKTAMLAGLVLALTSFAAWAEPLDDAINQMQASEAKLQSLSAKSQMTQDMDLGEGNSVKSRSEGTLEWARKGDKKVFRSQMNVSSSQKFAGQETKSDQKMLMISDGEYFYTLSEEAERKTAYKQKAGPDVDDDPKAILDSMREQFTLKLLPDAKVDGQDCYVIEATSKDESTEPVARQVMYFRKDVGVNVKTESRDKGDKPVVTHSLSDIKLNPDLSAERFVFKAPAGVEVMDMSQMGEPGGTPGAP